MMQTHIPLHSRHRLGVLALGICAVIGSFALGVRSTGTVQPFTLIEAGSIALRGDMDGDGTLTVKDVRTLLEIAQAYRRASPQQRAADPSGDGQITADDAIRLLLILENQ